MSQSKTIRRSKRSNGQKIKTTLKDRRRAYRNEYMKRQIQILFLLLWLPIGVSHAAAISNSTQLTSHATAKSKARLSGDAATYNHTQLTSGDKSVYLTCKRDADCNYVVLIEGENLTGLGGSNVHINGTGEYDIRTNMTVATDKTSITCTISSSTAPKFYTPLYVLMPGEVSFSVVNGQEIDWGECGTTPTPDPEPSDFDPTENLALNKNAYAGQYPSDGFAPSKAVDGDLNSRFASSGTAAQTDYSVQWWYVDLGAFYALDKIDIFFEGAYSQQFELQACKTLLADSTDAKGWFTIASFEGTPKVGQTEESVNSFAVADNARYVRIKSSLNSLNNQYGMSMWEFRVYGTGYATENNTKPIVSEALVTAIDQVAGTVTVRLHATQTATSTEVHRFRLVNNETQAWRDVTTDANHIAVLDNLTPCEAYNVSVYAVSDNYVLSDAYSLSFTAPAGNMAYGRTATAGYSEGNLTPEKAVDGSTLTRWSSYGAGKGNAWWMIDLGDVRALDSIRLNLENNWIEALMIETSPDGGSCWAPIVVTTAPPKLGVSVYETKAIGRYLRAKPREKNADDRRNWSIYEFEVYGACSYDNKPRMLLAYLDTVTQTTATIQVGATDAVTSFCDLKYNYILTDPTGTVRQENGVTLTDGLLELTELTPATTYTLEIWAVDSNDNRSENSVTLSFTTLGVLGDLYLISTANGWTISLDYQFSETKVKGIYSLRTKVPAGGMTYKLSTGDKTGQTAENHQLYVPQDTVVTFYAKDYNIFASTIDSIYVWGNALGCANADPTTWRTAKAHYCHRKDDGAYWNGTIDQTGQYQIIKIAHKDGSEYVYKVDFATDLQTITGLDADATQGAFVIDLPTLSWKWEPTEQGQCTYYGYAGDGQTGNGASGLFKTGYLVTLYMNARQDTIFVTTEFLDTDVVATNALVQNYPQRNEALEINEFRLNRDGNTQVFRGSVPVAGIANRADGIIRFGIKFEYPGGLRVTTPEFYYLDGSGCAERDFVIYHHGQTPDDAEAEAVESFKGGRILQPIQYKRKFRPGIWETLCLPFEVKQVSVYDADDDTDYTLYAQYTNNGATVAGEYWLRVFTEQEVTQADFQPNWHDIAATQQAEALPKRGVAYIMRVPAGDYYIDKYIVFSGDSYQKIDSTYSTTIPLPSEENYFSYSGNNTMRQWSLTRAYVLDNAGEYFESDAQVTLWPFECAVNAELQTTQRMPRLAMNHRENTPTELPTTEVAAGAVYTIEGYLVGRFADMNEAEHLLGRLNTGAYIVRSGAEATKLIITK